MSVKPSNAMTAAVLQACVEFQSQMLTAQEADRES